MKSNLLLIILLVGYCSGLEAQNFISITNYPDTIKPSDTLIFEIQASVRDNGAPCSPLLSVKDTLNSHNLSFDLTYDYSGAWSFSGCPKLDTIYYSTIPQVDSIILTCYFSTVDTLQTPPFTVSRFDTASVVVHIANVTGLKETKHNIGFNLYPNPSGGSIELNIESVNPDKYYIKVFDLLGHLVHAEEVLFNPSISHKIDLAHLKKGMYLVSFENEKEKLTKKIVLK